MILLERFGDTHLRYALRNASVLDVVREGAVWRGYARRPGAHVGVEIDAACNPNELLQRLERRFAA